MARADCLPVGTRTLCLGTIARAHLVFLVVGAIGLSDLAGGGPSGIRRC